ncbi:MAG: hypothetical protein QXS79_01080 [Candidatus Bathyarchaeia archaeon]
MQHYVIVFLDIYPDLGLATILPHDYIILGFHYMHMPRKYVEESLFKKGLWGQLLKLWQIVENDYDLKRLQEEFMFTIERESKETLKSLQEWRTFWHEHLMRGA